MLWFSAFLNCLLADLVVAKALYSRSLNTITRRATCTPATAGSASTDDVPAIEAAFKSCGAGGIIFIPAGKTYMLRSTLDLTGCSNCDFQVEGTLKASDDTSFWNGKNAIISVSGINGAKIRSLTGSGLIDGNGQASYDRFANDSSYKRPKLLNIGGKSSNIAVSNLRFKNPPSFFLTINGNSTLTTLTSLTLTATSNSTSPPKNTDGVDIGPATHTSLTNLTITNQDDCLAFKPGTNYVSASSIHCTGSHGLSIGSLANSPGTTDSVSNILITNATMHGATKAVGIKLYPGGAQHGTAIVKNVTWDGVRVEGCDYAAQIQSCYNEDKTYCEANPSTARIEDVVFRGFVGVTSERYDGVVANLNCPKGGTCGVRFEGWEVEAGRGVARVLCGNVGEGVGVECRAGAEG